MALSTETNKSVDLKIHDPAGTFFAWVWVAFFMFMSLISLGAMEFFLALLFFPLTYGFFLVARTKTEGVTVSMDDKSIRYPGGSIAAESMFVYFTPSFWLQSTKAHTTKFSDITQLRYTQDTTVFSKIAMFFNDPNSKTYVRPFYRYGVGIDGAFGSANIYFRNDQKAMQLFGILRQYLKAGVPVVDVRS